LWRRDSGDHRAQILEANQSAAHDRPVATGGMAFATRSVVNPTTAIVLVASQHRRPRRPHAYREQAMTFDKLSRRHLLKGTAALTLGTALPLRGAFAAETTVGFIYVGSRDDYGYNQAHAAGAAALKKMPGIKVVEEEKVPETDAVEKTMESMINLDGATLLFPTSFGYYNPHMIKTAAKFPKLRFEHCGGLWSEKDPKNAGSYFGYIDEAQHVSGIVAGFTSKTGKLGFVAAKPIPQVLRNINAFTLGAKLANPKVTTQVIFTGDWSMPVKEAEATNSLIDQGVDVLTCHVDGPKTVVENAARRGAFVCGYHVNQSVLAPQAYLTGAEWNWEVLYPRFAKMFTSGEAIPNFYRGGLKEELVKVSPYGPAVSEEAKKKADEVKAALTAGNYVIFKGPIADNKGGTAIAGGVSRGQTDPELEKMSYLVEGVIGATS
jgi:basic membrane protein A and related proteins